MEILLESTTKKRYKCPYCDIHDTKDNLIVHVNDIHNDLLPEDYTAARVVFNYIYKKNEGRCTECGKETKWNEDRCRYDRQCSDRCRKIYSDKMHSHIMNVYGIWNLCSDPEHLKKMLENRKISGTYKFINSVGVRSYTGSYEKKCLQFMDSINIPAYDIITPGPIIEYPYTDNGEEKILTYITDIYYAPYNLIIECKDGGSNPNNREMKSYREKQIAKEAQLRKIQKYNYIRLTDNQFDQLLYILSLLKLNLGNDDKIIQINESELENKFYLIQNFIEGNLTSEWYISPNLLLDEIYRINEDNNIELYNKNNLHEYLLYELNRDNVDKLYNNIKQSFTNKVKFLHTNLYEYFTDSKLLSEDQPLYNTELSYVDTIYDNLSILEQFSYNNIKYMGKLPDGFIPKMSYIGDLYTEDSNIILLENLESEKILLNINNGKYVGPIHKNKQFSKYAISTISSDLSIKSILEG